MLPLYEDSHFTFRFADARLVPRFHLAGVAEGRGVTVYRIDPATGVPLERLAVATAGADGWVELAEPIAVRPGEAFVAVPERPDAHGSASPPCQAPPGYWGEDDLPPQ